MGMLSFDVTCPHCLRENAVLQAFGENRKSGDERCYDVAFTCRSCSGSGIAVVHSNDSYAPLHTTSQSTSNVVLSLDAAKNRKFAISEIIPEIKSHEAPENTPERAAKFFIESKDDFQRGRYETSVMNCRKVIDISTKYLMGESVRDINLNKRINTLFEQGKITEQMNSWAHIVRIDGNGAAHSDEEISKEEAEQILGFTEVFLMYSFTLPAMIERRRSESGEAE
ncbi:DUF4145 domain-containing protein [Providencia rettgeri]|uniref:DUF4145 domain-containing protein n=1 Tax=Providencia rettgeri TaxID=587 RepID=UPI001E62DF42|nr:DUF4145 domain-containing protein [Providencia rettgeri]UEK58398.1 DUF4145 domain-containing protein [Providencia rettgeri]